MAKRYFSYSMQLHHHQCHLIAYCREWLTEVYRLYRLCDGRDRRKNTMNKMVVLITITLMTIWNICICYGMMRRAS